MDPIPPPSDSDDEITIDIPSAALKCVQSDSLDDFIGVIDDLSEKTTIVTTRDSSTGRSIFHEACALGRARIAQYLLETCEINISTRTMMGYATPLHLAVNGGHRSLVFLLLSYGADPLTRDKFGNTALHYAVSRSTAKLLVKFGAKVNTFNKKKADTLAVIGKRGAEDVSKELVTYLQEISQQEYIAEQKRLREEKETLRKDTLNQIYNKKRVY